MDNRHGLAVATRLTLGADRDHRVQGGRKRLGQERRESWNFIRNRDDGPYRGEDPRSKAPGQVMDSKHEAVGAVIR